MTTYFNIFLILFFYLYLHITNSYERNGIAQLPLDDTRMTEKMKKQKIRRRKEKNKKRQQKTREKGGGRMEGGLSTRECVNVGG